MPLYRLNIEVANYLSVEVIAESLEDLLEKFTEWARAKCKRSGGTWADEEIDRVETYIGQFQRNPGSYENSITVLSPSLWVDGEPYFA